VIGGIVMARMPLKEADKVEILTLLAGCGKSE
jgi:hypothetical protein